MYFFLLAVVHDLMRYGIQLDGKRRRRSRASWGDKPGSRIFIVDPP